MAYRDRSRQSASLSVNLTPLLDVVLQLITFFMMLIHFGTKIEGQTAAIRLPSAPAALPGGDVGLDRLVVGIDAKGKLLAEGASLDADSAAAWWLEQGRKRRGGLKVLGRAPAELPTQVVIRSDRDASFGAVRGMLTKAQDQGFARFSLIVLRGGQP
jgi:biopolymer transport protein ExbD